MANSNKQTGLGRGFDALIPQDFDNTLLVDEQDRIQKLLITDITPNRGQPRSTFDKQLLQELADSIKEHGILQPIIVRAAPGGGYSIVAGERRWRAAQLAGLEHIPAIVRTMEDMQQVQIALVENVQRVDLSLLEQAASIQALCNQFGMTHQTIGEKLGKAESTIRNIARLLDLPAPAQEAMRDGLINEGHGRAILAIKAYPEKQAELLRLILANHWTVRQAEQFAIAVKKGDQDGKVARQKAQATTPETEKLSKKIGKQVSIRRLAKGGKLEIAFASDEDLEKLIELLSKLKAKS